MLVRKSWLLSQLCDDKQLRRVRASQIFRAAFARLSFSSNYLLSHTVQYCTALSLSFSSDSRSAWVGGWVGGLGVGKGARGKEVQGRWRAAGGGA